MMSRTIWLAPLLATTLVAQSFTVTGVTPSRHARGVSPAANVTLVFDAAVDPLTVLPQNLFVEGRYSGPVPGTWTIGPGGTSLTFTPGRPYFASETVTIRASRFLRSAAGVALAGGFYSTFSADAAAGSNSFQLDLVFDFRLPGEGLIRTYGFYAGDIDKDGSPDMTAANEVSYDIRLHKNDGAGTFGGATITPMPNGHEPSPNEGGDVNGDGWIDFVTGNQNGQSIAVFLNDGAGNYLPPTLYPTGGQVHGLALTDYDADGDLDVVAPNFTNLALFSNNGNGTFAPATFVNGGIGEWCVAVADLDNDGRPDLLSGNFSGNTVGILRNNGAGGFTLTGTVPSGGNVWAIETGDLDGNGVADVVVANNSQATVGVLRGNGTGGLVPVVTYPVGSNAVWIEIGDLDGDDDLDVTAASFGAANATFYRNAGNGTLGGATVHAAQSAASSVVIVDYDRDGDSDVFVTDELSDRAFLYRQTGPSPASTQPPTAAAALRVNSHAARAGFGGRPALPLPGGQTVFLNVSGAPNQPFLLLAGPPAAVATPSAAGFINLQLNPFPAVLADGFSAGPPGLLDAHGEAWFAYPIPVAALSGVALTIQALVLAPLAPSGAATTNPESVLFL